MDLGEAEAGKIDTVDHLSVADHNELFGILLRWITLLSSDGG